MKPFPPGDRQQRPVTTHGNTIALRQISHRADFRRRLRQRPACKRSCRRAAEHLFAVRREARIGDPDGSFHFGKYFPGFRIPDEGPRGTSEHTTDSMFQIGREVGRKTGDSITAFRFRKRKFGEELDTGFDLPRLRRVAAVGQQQTVPLSREDSFHRRRVCRSEAMELDHRFGELRGNGCFGVLRKSRRSPWGFRVRGGRLVLIARLGIARLGIARHGDAKQSAAAVDGQPRFAVAGGRQREDSASLRVTQKTLKLTSGVHIPHCAPCFPPSPDVCLRFRRGEPSAILPSRTTSAQPGRRNRQRPEVCTPSSRVEMTQSRCAPELPDQATAMGIPVKVADHRTFLEG